MNGDNRRTEKEMTDVIDNIDPDIVASGTGSQWPGMTYEQGVDNALRWAAGLSDENPMDD